MARQENRNNQQIDPQRLCDAAEAALRAAVERVDAKTGEWTHPMALLGTPDQPTCLAEFTKIEIEQACEFLVRMGYLQPPRRAA
ncbi:MAG: hypothetical protein IT436_03940 [Phycisphaerales bacterium]|nr:hypothetical protein [Phycisphaerales bacterium]